jgi:tetratricopeptide (TPR) repeat protein
MGLTSLFLLVASKVAEAILVDFVKDKVVGLTRKPDKTYQNALRDCIYETIEEFDKSYKQPLEPTDQFPFYQSQDLMVALSKTVLFAKNPTELSVNDFEENPYFLPFTNEDVKSFYNLFLEKVASNEVLKETFIKENYQERVFNNAEKLDLVNDKLDVIIDKIDNLETRSLKREGGKELSSKLPLLLGSKFIKRENDLEDLRNRLLNNQQVVLVNGMGGIGKTTLAQMYMTKHYHDYKHLLWVSTGSASFLEDFNQTQGLGQSLGISLEGKTPEQYFNALIVALKKLYHSENEQSLLVIDNAEANIIEHQHHFPHPPHWHVLATSREYIKDFDVKELDFLNEAEAVELFKLHYQRKKISEDDIKKIVKGLEYHTLTIEVLAKTAHNDGLDVEETVKSITKDYDLDVYSRHAEGKIGKITSYLSSIFDLSKLSEEELWLLQQFYFLPPNYHTINVIREIFGKVIPNSEIRIQRILTKLKKKGWLLYELLNEDDDEIDGYKLHRIIGDVINHSLELTFEKVEFLTDSLTSLLSIDQTKDNPVDKFPWVPFGNYLLTFIDNYEEPSISKLENNLALVLQDLGDYQGAKTLLEKVLASAEKNFGAEHPTTAVSYSNLGNVLRALGDYQGAKILLEKALASDEKNFGLQHPTTAISYSNLALVLQELGDYQGAKTLLEKAMASDEKNFGLHHPKTAVRYSNLALVLKALGDYQGAKALLEKAMASDEKNFGVEHPTTAVSYSNLGIVLKALGDYQGAKTLLEKAMASAEKNFGVEHPTTAVHYSNLALVLQDLGDYQGAKTLLEKAMASAEKNFGVEHPATAVSYSNLGSLLQDLGDYQGAKTLLEKAMASAEKNFEVEHPTTAVRYSNLGGVLGVLGDYQGAKTLLEKAVEIFQNHLGKEHPNTITVASNLYYLMQVIKDQEDN